MGTAQNHAIGERQQFYAIAEATFGTYIRPSATSAIKVRESKMKSVQERKDRKDAHTSRSVLQRITGKKTTTWSCKTYTLPSGSAGTPPDITDLLKAAMGVYTNTGGTSDVYSLSDSQSALGSVSITRHFNSVIGQAIRGAWVESMKISLSGSDEPSFEFEGGGVDMYHTNRTTLNGGVSNGASQIIVNAANAGEVGSVISVGTSNNSGGSPPGHIVTAKSGTTWTIDPVIVGAQSNGAEVVHYVPTETTAGSVLTSISTGSTITLDSVALPVTQFELLLKNNLRIHDDEAFSAVPTDYTPGWREVSGTMTVRARRDQVQYLGNYRNAISTVQDLQIVCGATAGSILTVDCNRLEVDMPELESPAEGDCMITLPFRVLGNTGADEFTLSWT